MDVGSLVVIVPTGLTCACLLVALLAYLNERRSDRDAPLKLSLLITLVIMGSWTVMTLIVAGFGYGVWRFLA